MKGDYSVNMRLLEGGDEGLKGDYERRLQYKYETIKRRG